MKGRPLGIAAVVIVVVGIGFALFRLPQPIIEIKPETLFTIGPLNVTNSILTGWVMVIGIALVTILGTRKLSLERPTGFQNLFESVIDGFSGIVQGVAGEKNGRRFFPVVFALLFYIILCNWTALTPVFNVIGKTDNVIEEAEHDAQQHPDEALATDQKISGWMLEKHGISVVPLFKKTKFVEVTLPAAGSRTPPLTECDRPRLILESLAASLSKGPALTAVRAESKAKGESATPCSAGTEGEVEAVLGTGSTYGTIAPFLRGVNTDVNAPLSYALWSAFFVEFWGISTLGLFGYGSKFLNFKKLFKGDIVNGLIDVFVGFLEFVSEVSRLVSFTFRLFGNIFAGEVLLFMMSFLVPFVLVDVFYGLELFVGLIQAFVFAMLTLIFGLMAVSGHGDHEEGHAASDAHEAEAHGAAH